MKSCLHFTLTLGILTYIIPLINSFYGTFLAAQRSVMLKLALVQ